MSTYVYGVKPQDAEWLKMKAAYESCKAAGVAVPQKVLDYFDFDDYEEEDITDEGLVVTLANYNGSQDKAVTPHREEMQDGFVVDLTKLDPEIKTIKFINSY